MLFSLLYVSKATRPFTEQQLVDLLQVAREKNQRIEITGLLLYKDDKFMQILEGEKDVVLELFRKIACDPRHYEVVHLLDEYITTRIYPEWSMGLKNLNSIIPEEFPGYSDFMDVPLSLDEFKDSPSRAKNLLMLFRLG